MDDIISSSTACPKDSLAAIIALPSINSAPLIADLAEERSSWAMRPGDIDEIVAANITLFTDAKAHLTQFGIIPTPRHKIVCLSTIKKLIAKNHGETINLPDLASATEAVAWLKTAAHEAFDRINKLGMAQIAAVECAVIPATLAMEQRGLPFDKTRWQHTLTGVAEECERLKHKLDELLPNDNGFLLFGQDPVDLNNANAVKASLEKLLGTKLKGTSQSSLKDFDHEAVKLVLRYREHARMLSTFGETFLAKIDNDRIKGHFTTISSASGRFACHDVNLLALPGDDAFQACLAPRAPYVIRHFDYGAFELRILAALCGDETLIRIFNDNLDIHAMVAQEIFGMPVSKTENAHLRDQAKVLNFGLIYGMGETALAKQLKISKGDANALLKNYFKRFSRVGQYLTSLEQMAKTKGYVETVLGRRAYLADYDDEGLVARLARNIPIQGTGADIIKLALCRVWRRLHDEKIDAHVVNLVHDEIVLEAHEDHRARAEEMTMIEMHHAFTALCPTVTANVSASST